MLRRQNRGFTLVEAVVVIAILAIVMGIAIPNFRSWIQNTQISTAASGILQGVQLARAEAITRNSSVSITLNNGTGWTITDSFGNNIQTRPPGEGAGNASTSVTLPSPAPTPLVLTFNGLGRLTLPSTQVSIIIRNDGGGNCRSDAQAGPMRCLNIVVLTGGQARLCDPARPSSDPQGC